MEKGCVNNCQDLVKAIKDLHLAVKTLQQDLKELKENKDSHNMDAIINEISDRQRREKNIIIYNVQELSNDSTANKRNADNQKAAEIIQAIAPSVETQFITAIRVGKNKNNSPAPIKVQLPSRDDVMTVLKFKHKLKTLKPGVQITTDRTQIQRDQFKKILGELKEREDQGEVGLYIKYINGNPTISTKSKN